MAGQEDERLVSVLVSLWLTAPDARVLCGLPFLTHAEVLLVADCVNRHTRRAMASSQVTIWRTLVRRVFPDASCSPCEAPSPSSKTPPASRSARFATWKYIFRLLATWESNLRLEPGAAESAQRRAMVHSGPDIVPVGLNPAMQERLRVKLVGRNLLLDVSLNSKDRKDGWILLRERVQVARRLDSSSAVTSRLKTMRHRLSTLRFGTEREPPAASSCESHSSGTIALTNTHILVQSSVVNDTIARIGDVEVSIAPKACSFTLVASNASIVITTATPESATAWVAVIARLQSQVPPSGEQAAPPKRLSTRWKAPQLPHIRSITCLGPSSNNSLFPRPLNTAKSAQVLDKHNAGSGASLSSGNALATVLTKANCLFKSLSFTESPSSSRYASTSVFVQQPRFASTRRSFPRPPMSFNDRTDDGGGVLALMKTRRIRVMKRSSMCSSSSATALEGSLAVDESQQAAQKSQSSLSLCEEHHDDNNHAASETAEVLSGLDGSSRRVHEVVFSLLQSTKSFEGHVYTRFFERQQREYLYDSTCAATCRSYLNKVRDCIQDLVQFILSFRLKQLQLCLQSEEEPQHDDDNDDITISACDNNSQHIKNTGDHAPSALASLVQDAVETYFFSASSRFSSSLPARVTKWCTVVTEVPKAAALERKLAQWSALPAESDAFALSNPRHVETSASVQQASGSLRAMGDEVAPSRKLARFLDAVRALNAHITIESPAAGGAAGAVCDADELLPLLIFALCRSRVSTPLAHCVAMQQLCAFSSPHGERVYYLTMLETAVEFVRTHSI